MTGQRLSAPATIAGNTLAGVALVALCAVAVAVVYTKHESRVLFIELQELSRERDALNAEWSRLQLEHSTYLSHNRIEAKAAGPLALRRPAPGDVFLITDEGDYRFVSLEPLSEEMAQLVESQTEPTP